MDRRTRCARGSVDADETGRPLAPPIVTASTFSFTDQDAVDRYYESGDGWVYARYGNPTVRCVERFMASLEGAEDAACFGSGMAAITATVLSRTRSGRRVAAQRELYGGSAGLLAWLGELGIDVIWLDRDEIAELAPERLEGCDLLYLETPTNPGLRIVDLRRAARAAREAGVPVCVDATFATPILLRPVELGVDLVVHSATKYLGGHSDLLGGVVSGSAEAVAAVAERRRVTGGVLDPFPAFLLHRGLLTLAVRMEAHGRGAEAIARFLEAHPRVETVSWPGLASHPDHALAAEQMDGFGGMVSFVVAGGGEAAARVHDRLRLFARAGSLGGTHSLASLPARMSHRHLGPDARRRAGIPDGMIRLSVGLEAPGDLVADLERALGD